MVHVAGIDLSALAGSCEKVMESMRVGCRRRTRSYNDGLCLLFRARRFRGTGCGSLDLPSRGEIDPLLQIETSFFLAVVVCRRTMMEEDYRLHLLAAVNFVRERARVQNEKLLSSRYLRYHISHPLTKGRQ